MSHHHETRAITRLVNQRLDCRATIETPGHLQDTASVLCRFAANLTLSWCATVSCAGMLAGLSMCFVRSSTISLYAAGKALEVGPVQCMTCLATGLDAGVIAESRDVIQV